MSNADTDLMQRRIVLSFLGNLEILHDDSPDPIICAIGTALLTYLGSLHHGNTESMHQHALRFGKSVAEAALRMTPEELPTVH